MNTKPFNIRIAKQFLPHIFMIAIGIGTANYIMYGSINWIQSVILSLSTSLIIGYTLVTIALNKAWFAYNIQSSWKRYTAFFLAFFLIGVIATEVEHLIKSLVFSGENYQVFLDGRKCIFNGIISLVLGFSFMRSNYSSSIENSDLKKDHPPSLEPNSEPITEPLPALLKIPVKQGEAIFLIPIQDIVYFEAFDNYSFVYDVKGEKRLCDSSLLFLQKRLGENFMRVHRKYIINTNHIKQIKPHLNARYIIQFDVPKLSPIISSKSYTAIIRRLIKIK